MVGVWLPGAKESKGKHPRFLFAVHPWPTITSTNTIMPIMTMITVTIKGLTRTTMLMGRLIMTMAPTIIMSTRMAISTATAIIIIMPRPISAGASCWRRR